MNIGRNDIDWRNLSHDEIDRIIAERIEADDRPVSYTHLDVYKRQLSKREKI